MSENYMNSSSVKNYKDRGIMKWAGFYLSDHTAALGKEKVKRDHVNVRREKQSLEEISECLFESFIYRYAVSVQLDVLDKNDEFVDDIRGVVDGFEEDDVYIAKVKFSIEDVRNVEKIDDG
jgi:hypothetical protein